MVITGYDSVFLYVQVVSILSDHIVQANFVHFDDDFTGFGAVVGMLLQCTFKSFCHPRDLLPHMAYYFSLPLLVISPTVSFKLEKFFSH